MRRAAASIVAFLAIVAALGGCGQSEPQPAPRPKTAATPATATSAVPDVPDEAEPEAGMEIVIKNPRADRSADEGAYRRDPRIPQGKLVGACTWASSPPRRKAPKPKPIDLAGAHAIRNPDKGETEYYQNLKLTEHNYIADKYPGTFPRGVVLMLRDVRAGPRAPLRRSAFMVREGRFKPHIRFSPLHERVMFGTYDSFPTHVRVKALASGLVAMDQLLRAFDRDTIKPLGGGGVHYTVRPTMLQSKVVHDMGVCSITCTRHPWKQAYVVFVDNPYIVLSNDRTFTMANVPVGTWRMDVWHPQFKPARESYEVVIRKDETSEIAVELEPPECLKSNP
jgi:hypothetical protein